MPIVEAGALPALVALSQQPVLECQRSAALALYSLSCAAANQMPIVEAGAPVPLFQLAASADVDCRRYAVMTLCNLAANAETRSRQHGREACKLL